MDSPKIRDIPALAKILKEARNLAALKGCMPLLRPFLRALGADMSSVDENLKGLDQLRTKVDALVRIPDQFNELLAPLGWIIHADMNLDVAEHAVNLATKGDTEAAEQVLVDYYAPAEVKWMLRRMEAVEAFRPRMRLAELALDDYAAGRLHACIPVVLSILDGFVSQLHGDQRGFFAQDADLTAWDSIAAHETGLNALTTIFGKGRRKLNEAPLTIPYRHGILHGWDVTYDTPLVAAKTWGALLATREWALKVQQGILKEPAPEAEPTWTEVLGKFVRTKNAKAGIAAWKPRRLVIGEDIPARGNVDDYAPGTPEAALVGFLELWSVSNYGFMARDLGNPLGHVWKPATVRSALEGKALVGFQIIKVTDEAPVLTEIETVLEWDEDGTRVERGHAYRLIYWHPEGGLVVRGDAGGRWSIINWSV